MTPESTSTREAVEADSLGMMVSTGGARLEGGVIECEE